MKNIHIIPNEKFTLNFIKKLESEFPDEENLFLVIKNAQQHGIKEKHNVIFVDFSFKKVLSVFKTALKYDKIFLHNISYIHPFLMLLLSLISKKYKKQYWILWGMDLYYYEKRKKSIKSYIIHIIRSIFIRNLYGIIFGVKGEYELARKWYKTKAKYFEGSYCESNMDFVLSAKENETLINDGMIRIQVGNSASERNNHIDALRKLSLIKKENLLIYCPLSYSGSEEYVNSVISEGRTLFGDRFIPITGMMSKQEYVIHLNNIDIAIFNTDRQMGLSNISLLLALGKKVYINDYTTPWEAYKTRGNILFAFNKLNFEDEISLNDFFTPLTEEEQEKNKEIVFKRISMFAEFWKNIFNS